MLQSLRGACAAAHTTDWLCSAAHALRLRPGDDGPRAAWLAPTEHDNDTTAGSHRGVGERDWPVPPVQAEDHYPLRLSEHRKARHSNGRARWSVTRSLVTLQGDLRALLR